MDTQFCLLNCTTSVTVLNLRKCVQCLGFPKWRCFLKGPSVRLLVLLITDIDIGIIVNRNSVDTRWHQYSTHLRTNSTQHDTINSFGWKAFWDSNPEW